MNRKLFCVSLAIIALLPTLFAFFDDESYQYIADVSFKSYGLFINHIIRTILKNPPKLPWHKHLQVQPPPLLPPLLPMIVTVVSFLEGILREGNFREGEILERGNF